MKNIYKGSNLYSAYIEAMAIFNHIDDSQGIPEEIYDNQFFRPFCNMMDEAGYYILDALSGWEGHKHWDLWKKDWHYPCKFLKDEDVQIEGITCFPADKLFWHKDGFYCKDCIEDYFTITRPGRSLEKEIQIAKQRKTCYRTLPDPVMFYVESE